MSFNLPSLFAAGVDDVKGNPFDDSLLLCDEVFCKFCAGLKPKLLCNVLVNDGCRAEKSVFMKPTFMSRTCILIFSRTSLCCWKFWRFWTPMLRAERLLSMPRAWFVGNCGSLKEEIHDRFVDTEGIASNNSLHEIRASVRASTAEIHACVSSVHVYIHTFITRIAIAQIILSIRVFIDMWLEGKKTKVIKSSQFHPSM